ncbi:hypothetical protein TRAPUB_9381 [Trametes pubescens]|uniref:Uncharacterized protein n=1 Tax=Trametes pubescens TaxID=154538 RepID=A0A1M2W2I6_TRAPU|nr:hypothetical protein TRAPUB_9381 [Trametes pubescens]
MPDLAGDVVRLFYHEQPGHAAPQIFAEMMWMEARPASEVAGNPPELEVKFWKFKHYQPHDTPGIGPPPIIPVDTIQCQLARGICAITKPKLWVTTTLEKVSISMELLAEEVADAVEGNP